MLGTRKGDKMVSKIDTIQISTDKTNFKDLSIVNADNKPYIVKTHERGERIFIGVHISRTQGNYNYSLHTHTYNYFKQQLEWVLKDLKIIDTNKVNLDRVDYCFDYDNSFGQMYKLNNMILLLYALEIKADLKNIIETNTILDQERTSLQAYNRGKSKQLYIYNKAIESDNRHLYDTRQEFRQMRLSLELNDTNVIKVLKANYEMLNRLQYNFETMQQVKIKHLYELYLREVAEGKINSFSVFITRYQEQIGTRYICEQLYFLTGHKGKFKNWIKDYRKKVKIKFVSESELKKTLSDMKKSVKAFWGSDIPLFLWKNTLIKVGTSLVFIMDRDMIKVKVKCLCMYVNL